MKKNDVTKYLILSHVWFFALTICSCLYIAFVPRPIQFDQNFITSAFKWSNFPRLNDGILSHLIVQIYNSVIHPDLHSVNSHIKILALIMYVCCGYLLAVRILRSNFLRIIFLVILFATGYPFLWLSSELFAGAFVCLGVASIVYGWNFHLQIVLIVLLGHTKPDVMAVSVVLLGYIIATVNGYKKKLLAVFLYIFLNGIVVMPGLIQNHFQLFSDRSFVSFGQHYSALLYPHQLLPNPPLPFVEFEDYLRKIFPDAQSMKDIISKYPKQYYDYVWLSFGHGVKRIFSVFRLMIPWLVFVLVAAPKKGKESVFVRITFLCFIGIVPMIFFSFPHTRYLARFFPLALIVLLSKHQELPFGSRSKLADILLVITSVVLSIKFGIKLGYLTPDANFWFPD